MALHKEKLCGKSHILSEASFPSMIVDTAHLTTVPSSVTVFKT